MILAEITVGCQSNSHRVSSISDLLAPAAQTSSGGTACSCLPWPVVLPHRPHRPTLLHCWSGHSSTHPHLMLFSGDGSRTSKPSYSPPRGQPLPSLPRLRVVPFLGLARPGQRGQRTTSIGRGLYAQNNDSSTRQLGPTGRASVFREKNVPPADMSDPPAISSHARKCLLITHKKMNTPLLVGTHHSGRMTLGQLS